MHFDEKASEWDNDPEKVERATVFAKEIDSCVQSKGELHALEFGSGTGLLSFRLKDAFKTITLIDTSEGMMEVLREKIKKEKINNFIPLMVDLFDSGGKIAKTDVIYTLMTLHHMPDIDRTLGEFNSILNPDGYLCIGDLVQEDGSFHSHHTGFDGHNGFAREDLSNLLIKNGFRVVLYKEFFEIEKKNGEKIVKYPLFLIICRKIKDTRGHGAA